MDTKHFWQIAKTTIKNRKWIFIILLIINIASVAMYAALSPELDKQAADLSKIVSAMPEAFLKAFNVSAQLNGGYEGLVVTKHFALLLPIFLLMIGINLAGTAIAGEINKDTILMYLTQPISRAKYFWCKYLTGLAMIVVFAVVSVMIAVPFGWLFNLDVEVSHYMAFTVSTLLFGWALYSISFLASSYASDMTKVTLISTGVFFFSYIFNVLSQLITQLADLKYFSLLYYFGPDKNLIEGSVLVFTGIALICTIMSYRVFIKRDIAIR